jgi:rhamnulokinase
MNKHHLAVDIGASSGRVMAGWLEKTGTNGSFLKLEEIHRFENGMKEKDSQLVWDIDHLYQSIIHGIKKAVQDGYKPITLGIDTWAVDYVLLDEDGKMLTDAVAYRDSRTDGIMKEVFETIPKEDIYERTGIQFQPFNTLYQLVALKQRNPEVLEKAKTFLMIPDYLNYLLTGQIASEYTNATSTQFVNIKTNDWDKELLKILGIPTDILKPIQPPGTTLGKLRSELADEVGTQLDVVLPATHDTGSAVVAVPENKETLYLSSGTWSLLGIETLEPITTSESLNYNFTNEGGVDYRYRFLKNIMGLWMIQEVRRLLDNRYSFGELVDLARETSDFSSVVDVNDSRFLSPKNMIKEIQNYCKETNQDVPTDPGELAQTIYISLAKSYTETIKEIENLKGITYEQINIIGGGSQNELLNELLARESGLIVVTGPIEATAIGNTAVQMITSGEISDLQEARNVIRQSFQIKKYNPKEKKNEC